MLATLEIRNILLIDHLALDFRPGLNALTGETGAGKSILLDALGMVLGWRGRADVVRAGADQGEVTASFDLAADHPVFGVLRELEIGGDELILRRTSTPDGRKQAYVNDRRVTGESLRLISDHLVELHGQHDDQGLLDQRGHRALLDAFGGHDILLAETRATHHALSEARRILREAEEAQAKAAQDQDFLTHAVAELTKLAPEPGEEQTLDARRRLMQQGAKIGEDVARALAALGTGGAGGALGDTLRRLETLSAKSEGALDEAVAALTRAITELGEAEDFVSRYMDALNFDPGELERVEERLFAIRALARKHGVLPDDLAAHAATLAERLEAVSDGGARLTRLASEVSKADAAYLAAARGLSSARKTAALALDQAMALELPPLKLERARFETEVTDGTSVTEGSDLVRFLVRTNPGAPAGAINQIASGGELSRFLLALKVCLSARASGLTMIFDEIDRGVGGATANAVGRRLAAMAAGGQILVVTHSPQVAAFATRHWRVEKRDDGQVTTSHVVALSPDERVAEIARMLSGDTVTEAALAAARELIAAA
jgi:DNA repair protein RecN (Recombination protein N)